MEFLSLMGAFLVNVTGWMPVDTSQFWVEPEKQSVLFFVATSQGGDEAIKTEERIPYEFKTTDGGSFCCGEGVFDGKRLRIETSLPQGFFELELPQTDQTFGIASQPAYCPNEALLVEEAAKRNDLRERDIFFGIDAASTWLVKNNQVREELIRSARRIGIATYRERLSWEGIESKEGVFNWEGDRQSEFVRKTADKYDMPILELFHSAPSWTGKIGTYPADLIKTADSWGTIGNHWKKYWNSIEVWNEPDISFSGNLPADQYVPILKTVGQEFKRQSVDTPIVGGIIASFRDDFMDCLADNGIMNACDIFSFHTYCRAYDMERVSLRYHYWLVKNKAEWKPVWITECGRPWKKGTNRPNREADLESAIDIVQKGVAAKALGMNAYFPFVYVFYEENDNNFGMSDRNNAPLRSIAAYARSIYLLSGTRCIGSWNIDGVDRSYVFANTFSDQKIAVLYARECKPGRTIQLPMKPLFVERATGERLDVDSDNVIDFSDGFLYVGFSGDSELVMRSADEVDKARNLRLAASVKHGSDPRRNESIVLRYAYDPEQVTVNAGGYTIVNSDAKVFSGVISVYNFDDQTRKEPVCAKAFITTEDGVVKEVGDLIQDVVSTVEIPARSCAKIEFSLDSAKISPFHSPTLLFEVGSEGRTSFRLNRSVTEENFNSVVKTIVPVDLSELSRWRKNASKNHYYEFKVDSSESRWGFNIEFDEGDRWAYPVYKLPAEISPEGFPSLSLKDPSGNVLTTELSKFKGIAFTAKATSDDSDGVVRVFFHDEKGEYYFTASGVMKTDGNRRFICVPYSSLSAYGGTHESFDPSRIRAVSIGGNIKGKSMTVEVDQFCFFN